MKKIIIFFVLVPMCCAYANAQDLNLDDALRETYKNCVGIDDALHDIKVKAGINTAVTGLGTGLGIGAVATGIAKSNIDKTISAKYEKLKELSYAASGTQSVLSDQEFLDKVNNALLTNRNNNDPEIEKLETKSKKLGNWRTGLLAGNTATNVAGAIIAGTNKVDKSLEEQINDCKSSLNDLKSAIARAKFEGQDISEAKEIATICGEFEYTDISKINTRATGSMISSILGAGTGVAGTVTSAIANSEKIRNDNSEQGQKKETNLNTSANILAAGSTVASATATVFNAAQIKAIKDIAEIASKCTEVLK